MNNVKCPNGHEYDADKYKTCPECGKSAKGKRKTVKVRAVRKSETADKLHKAKSLEKSPETVQKAVQKVEKPAEVAKVAENSAESAQKVEKSAETVQKSVQKVEKSAETVQKPVQKTEKTEKLKSTIRETEFGKVRFFEPVIMTEITREIRNLPIKEQSENTEKITLEELSPEQKHLEAEQAKDDKGSHPMIEELSPDQKLLAMQVPVNKAYENEITFEELYADANIEADVNTVIDSANSMATDKTGKILIKYIGKNEIIYIPSEITAIGKYAFSGNTYVKKVIMPDSVKTIDKFAFSFCTNLETVVFSGELESIGENAFYRCSAIKELNFPNALKTIGKGAFGKCNSVTILNFPSQLKKISDFAFCECTSLNRVNLSKAVESIGISAFSKCHRLMRIIFSENLQIIGDSAFSWCSSLESVVIPPSVKTIGSFAFFGCDKLSGLEVSVNLKDVHDEAFASCDRVEKVTITELKDSNFNASYVKKAHKITLRILKQISERKAEKYANENKLGKLFI